MVYGNCHDALDDIRDVQRVRSSDYLSAFADYCKRYQWYVHACGVVARDIVWRYAMHAMASCAQAVHVACMTYAHHAFCVTLVVTNSIHTCHLITPGVSPSPAKIL